MAACKEDRVVGVQGDGGIQQEGDDRENAPLVSGPSGQLDGGDLLVAKLALFWGTTILESCVQHLFNVTTEAKLTLFWDTSSTMVSFV